MAQTRKRRRRKHRGTPAGTIERRGRTSKAHAGRAAGSARRMTAAERREARLNREPTWSASFQRAGIAALILLVFVSLVQHNVAAGAVLAAFSLVLYVPLGYYFDRLLWQRRMRKRQGGGR